MKQQTGIQTKFVDIPSLSETFADSLNSAMFDGQTMRIELCATRLDEPKPPKPPTGKKYPTCRLVLTPSAAIELFNNLQKLMGALEQAGQIKREPVIPPNAKPN